MFEHTNLKEIKTKSLSCLYSGTSGTIVTGLRKLIRKWLMVQIPLWTLDIMSLADHFDSIVHVH